MEEKNEKYVMGWLVCILVLLHFFVFILMTVLFQSGFMFVWILVFSMFGMLICDKHDIARDAKTYWGLILISWLLWPVLFLREVCESLIMEDDEVLSDV